MSCERKAGSDSEQGGELVVSDSEERCHCDGERSRTTDKWEEEDMRVEIQAEQAAEIKISQHRSHERRRRRAFRRWPWRWGSDEPV